MKKIRPFVLVAIIALILAAVIRIQYSSLLSQQASLSIQEISESKPKAVTPVKTNVPPEVKALPTSFSLDVPFAVQAPFAVWDELHKEACEEAALIMVKYFRDGKNFSSPAALDAELKKMIAWETANGYKVDVTMRELSEIARGFYGLKSGRIIKNPTVNDIKREIAAGRPVIVPAAGRLLGNPNFTAPGPIYHNLVIRGYDKNGWVTNDPGTRKGKNYRYSFDVLQNAMHDWDSTNILNGQKVVLVFD